MNHKCDTDDRVCFYEQEFYMLSNFSAFEVEIYGRIFKTSEHAYQWSKFVGTKWAWTRDGIESARSAHEAFKIAERNIAYRRRGWDEMKVEIMGEIIRAKADQHEYVWRKLLETGDRILTEDSWRDDFWGWGSEKDGLNMLGKLWMEVRAELQPIDEDKQ